MEFTKIDRLLKQMLDFRITSEAERQKGEKKLIPIRDKMKSQLERLSEKYGLSEQEIIDFIEKNIDFFEHNRIVRGHFGRFGLRWRRNKVIVSQEKKEAEIADELWKTPRLRKFVRINRALNKIAIREADKAGKLPPEIRKFGVEVFTGLVPFAEPYAPKKVDLVKDQEQFESRE